MCTETLDIVSNEASNTRFDWLISLVYFLYTQLDLEVNNVMSQCFKSDVAMIKCDITMHSMHKWDILKVT